jgi:hypothetical protein
MPLKTMKAMSLGYGLGGPRGRLPPGWHDQRTEMQRASALRLVAPPPRPGNSSQERSLRFAGVGKTEQAASSG